MAKKYLIFSLIFAGTMAFADNENYSGQDVSGRSFVGESHKNSVWDGVTAIGTEFSRCTYDGDRTYTSDYSNSSWKNADLTNASFKGAIINNADVSGAIIKGASFEYAILDDMSILTKTKSYIDKDLSGVNLQTEYSAIKKIAILDFNDFNLTGASLCANLCTPDNFYYTNPDGFFKYDDAIILGANMEKIWFQKEQFCSTKSYKDKMLDGIAISETNLSDIDFSGVSLKNANFNYINLTSANFSNANLTGAKFLYLNFNTSGYAGVFSLKNAVFFNANLTNAHFQEVILENVDFRGSNMTNTEIIYFSINPYKNTIMSDGAIKNFTMASTDDALTIRKYTPASNGDEMISAKISEDNAKISGGAVLSLERGADLIVTNAKTLTVASDGAIAIDTDLSASTKFTVDHGAGLVFENGAKLTINVMEDIIGGDVLEFTALSWYDDSYIAGLDTIKPNQTLFLNVNGAAYTGDWKYEIKGNSLNILINVPEPAEWAMILGAIAIAFALKRRCSKK